jgi:nitrite reductase/ring-hydroxylating ferredoxin subunit
VHPARPSPPHKSGLRIADLSTQRGRHVATPWGDYALYLVDGAPRCVQAFCPHMDGPLFEGSVADGAVVCPWHLWRYDVCSGKRVDAAGLLDRRVLARLAVDLAPDGELLLRPMAD